MREVETQVFIVNQRAFLRHVLTQRLAQCSVHQVRCGVVQTNAVASHGVDLRVNTVVHLQRSMRQLTLMANSLTVFLGVAHFKISIGSFQHALIANLTTGLTVERSLVQYHHGFFTGVDLVHWLTITEQRGHGGLLLLVVITAELAGTINTDHAVVVCAEAAGLTRTAALCFHCLLETGFIHFQTTFTAHVCRQIDRETVSVVQTECSFTIQGIALQVGQLFVQQRQATFQSAGKLIFFGFQHLLNQ
ncbi:hypothetical protein D3C80_1395920 [compost metagenome]